MQPALTRGDLSSQLLIGYGMACLFLTGCAGARYTPSTLPQQFMAQRPVSVHTLDLSRLSKDGPRADTLQPGDTVEVSIATGIEKGPPPKWDLRINENAVIDVPLIGPTEVRGISPAVAEARIRQQAIERGVYIDPKVTLRLKEPRTNRITVAGAVTVPDNYDVPVGSSDVLTSIAMARGFTKDADTVIEIRHPPGFGNRLAATSADGVAQASLLSATEDAVTLDLSRPQEIPKSKLQLYDGSIVTVRKREGREIRVMGLVNRPGIVEMPDDQPLTLLDAISEAGSTRISFANKVQIIRRSPQGTEPIIINASIRKAKQGGPENIELQAGDVVSVEETPATFVYDTLRSFFNVGFSAAVPGL